MVVGSSLFLSSLYGFVGGVAVGFLFLDCLLVIFFGFCYYRDVPVLAFLCSSFHHPQILFDPMRENGKIETFTTERSFQHRHQWENVDDCCVWKIEYVVLISILVAVLAGFHFDFVLDARKRESSQHFSKQTAAGNEECYDGLRCAERRHGPSLMQPDQMKLLRCYFDSNDPTDNKLRYYALMGFLLQFSLYKRRSAPTRRALALRASSNPSINRPQPVFVLFVFLTFRQFASWPKSQCALGMGQE